MMLGTTNIKDMTKLIVALSNFVNEQKKGHKLRLARGVIKQRIREKSYEFFVVDIGSSIKRISSLETVRSWKSSAKHQQIVG